MVHTGNNGRRIESTHDKTSDSERQRDQPLDSSQKSVFYGYKDRSDNGQCQISGNKDTDKWCHKEVKHCRYNLVKFLLNLCHYPYGNDNRNNMSLITNHIDRVQAKPYFLCRLNTLCCHGPCILQIRMDHDHTDNCTKIWIRTKYFCSTVCNQDRQECVCGITKQLRKHINGTAGIDVDKVVVYHKIQGFHDTHKETAGYDCRDDRYKDISQCLDQSLQRICFRCRYLFQLIFACLRNTCNLDKLIINLIYNTCSENDLHLSLCKEHTLYAVNIFHIIFVRFCIVCDYQSQSGCTVRCGNDIFFFSDMVVDFLCRFSVIHIVLLFPFYNVCFDSPLLRVYICYRFHLFLSLIYSLI